MNEKEVLDGVVGTLGDGRKVLGKHWSFNLRNDPKRLGFVLSRYTFCAKMGCAGKSVIELGCSEGIGTPILSESATRYHGVDLDGPAIETAKQNFENEKCIFTEADFLGKRFGAFDTVISMDVIEHIPAEQEGLFFRTVIDNMGEDGICIVGTPNITASAYASPASQIGHINLYSADRLASVFRKYFHTVFQFGINDEVVHTGYAPMAHYIVCVGCYKK